MPLPLNNNANEMVFAPSRAQRPNIKEVLARGPRSDKGDPQFRSLEEMGQFLNEGDVVFLVNKALYQLDYQSSFHKKRNEEMKLLRQKAKTDAASAEAETPTQVPAETAKPVASVQGKSLHSALAKLRKETDADLGPSGTFDFELEAVPPQSELSDEDANRLSGAFAKKDPL